AEPVLVQPDGRSGIDGRYFEDRARHVLEKARAGARRSRLDLYAHHHLVLREAPLEGLVQGDRAPPLGSCDVYARLKREEGNGKVEAADQRADAASDRDHAPDARVAYGFQCVLYRRPVAAEPRMLVERFLVHGRAHVQDARRVDRETRELGYAPDGDQPLREREARALAAQRVRRPAA